jgi:hypothetical protein
MLSTKSEGNQGICETKRSEGKEEVDATTDGQLLSSLVGVISEVHLDELGLSSLYELQASRRKSKLSSRKNSASVVMLQNLKLFPNEWHV